MPENKHVEEHVVDRKVEITGDDQPAGTNNPQPAPEAPTNEEKPTENSTQNQQDAVEKTEDKGDSSDKD